MNEKSIGSLLLDSGKISSADAEKILRLQKEGGLRFGDAGKALRLLTEEDIQQTLALQFNFPFLLDTKSGIHPDLIAYHPFSTQIETYRAIRSQLMLRWFINNRKTLAIVSPDRGEGRSFLAANLAIVFSLLGENTLLIDADLRQPRQHLLFGCTEKKGLSDLLAGRADMSVIMPVAPFKGLSVLSAGTIPPNPSELLSKKLGEYLEQFASTYDVILIDTSSASQGTDTLIAASKAMGVLLLARQHYTRMTELAALKESLESIRVACVGTVLSDF